MNEVCFLTLVFDEKGLLEIKATSFEEGQQGRLDRFAEKIRAALGVADAAGN